MRPLVIYLDTQDYSRFGDVLRGKSDSATEQLFLELERRVKEGDAIFALSMAIVGELLQYNADFRETTIRKAEAAERLCGSWALAFPSRLVAAEVARAAQRRGLISGVQDTSTLSSERYWYPNIGDTFTDIRAQLQQGLTSEAASLNLSRAVRRGLKKKARTIDYAVAAREAAPLMATEYGLPVDAFTDSIVALLQGKVTPEQASKRLFGAIAEPVKFVETYFEKVETDRSAIPNWVRKFGEWFESQLENLRNQFHPFVQNDTIRGKLDALVAEWPAKLGRTALGFASESTGEFGVSDELFSTLISDDAFSGEVPTCEIVGKVLTAYVRQVTGLAGNHAKIERSFGGDLVHALYLPHVDLWRGDRRFSTIIKDTLPLYASRVIPTLKELPSAIEASMLLRRDAK